MCLFVSGGVVNAGGNAVSLETLLDILLVLYDECQTPALRRDKRISEFVDFGKTPIEIVFSLLLNRWLLG